jgi:zinc transport system substrate-binding protein
MAGCQKAPTQTSKKPLILVSVAPYQYIASRIGGQHVEVRSIVPQGADAHSFEPTPRQREALKEAKVWFRIGELFEEALLALPHQSWRILDLREGIDLISHSCSHCRFDPQDRHMWMSPHLLQKQAAMIAGVLCEKFPMHRIDFESNLQSLIADLESLDMEIRGALEPMKNSVLLVSHPAFGYFCRDYDLEQLSVEFEGKDPRPKHLEFVMRQRRPDVAIALPQHNNKGAQMIAEAFHLPIKTIDPYSYDYFEMMRVLTKWIEAQ